MTLKLAIEITASAAGAKKGIGEARAEVEALDQAAAAAASQVGELGDALQAKTSASNGAASQSTKVADALKEEAKAASEATRTLDALAEAERRAAAGTRTAGTPAAKPATLPERMSPPANDPGTPDPERVRRMRAEILPLVKAEEDHAAAIAKVREAERIGALTSGEAEAQVVRLNNAYRQTTERLRALEKQGGTTWASLRPDQKLGIARQVPDIVGSLGMGMSVGQVAIQQGPQIVDQAGGVSASLGLLRSVITPVTVGLGLLTAATVAGGAAWLDYAGRTREASDAARAYGVNTGTTAADIERAAKAASAAGTASVSTAREIATELTRTGKVGADQFGGLIGVTRDFAATLRTDVATAANRLGNIIGDPATGAAQLRQMGLLDGATQRLVQRLVEQNRTQEASQVLLTALQPRIAGAAEATTGLGRAWDYVTRSASNAWSAIGKAVDRATGGGTDEDRLAELRARLQRPTVAGRLQGTASRQRDQAEIAELEARIKSAADKAEADRKRAEDDRRGSAAVSAAGASPVNEQIRERIRLEAQLQQLLAGQSAGNLTVSEQGQIADAIEATRRALDGLATAKERQVQLDRLDLQIQAERDPVAKANLVAERERIRLSGEQTTSAKAVTEVERARTKSLEESAAAARLSTRSIVEGYQQQEEAARLSLRMVNASPAAQARAQAELQARQQAVAEGLKPDSADAQDRIRAAGRAAEAASRAQAAQAARSTLDSQRDQIEMGQLELSLMGQSEAARSRAIALLQAEQQIRQQLIDTGSAEAGSIRARALQVAELETLKARQTDAWQTYSSSGAQAFDTIGASITGGTDSLKNFGNTAQSVISDLYNSLLKLAVLNPLKNAVFGTNLGTLSDLKGGGGLLGSLLGGTNRTSASGSAATASGTAVGGTGANVLALSRSYTGLSETRDTSAIQSILSASGTAALDPTKQAWCAAYANAVLAKSGMAGTGSNMASSFLNWGQATSNPQMGDVVNLKPQSAGSSGHVGFFAGRDDLGKVLVSAGNQGNAVSTASYPADQVVSFRTALTDATSATSGFASGLGDAARTATSSLGGATGQLGGASSEFGGAAADAANSATSFSTGLGSAFESILGGLGNALGGIGKGFSGLFSGFSGGGGTVGSTVGASFAMGGIMTSRGPLPLRAYSAGGVANTPQLALYGEGKMPEAYVPLPDGRTIPVSMRVSGGGASQPAAAPPMQVTVINNAGAEVKTTATSRPGGGQDLTIVVDAVKAAFLEDLHMDGPMSSGISRRFGVSAAGGLG